MKYISLAKGTGSFIFAKFNARGLILALVNPFDNCYNASVASFGQHF